MPDTSTMTTETAEATCPEGGERFEQTVLAMPGFSMRNTICDDCVDAKDAEDKRARRRMRLLRFDEVCPAEFRQSNQSVDIQVGTEFHAFELLGDQL